MTSLLCAAVFFVLLHLVVSGTRLRDVLVRAVGQGAYMGLFSLASVAGLAWLGFAFAAVRGTGGVDHWDITPLTRHIQLGLMLLAVLLIVPGLLTPNPTSVSQEGALEKPDVVKGMLRITRHPFLWGVAIWGAGHLLVNGDEAGIVLFAAILALALFGTASIDAKRRRALGATYEAFTAQTSNVPFAAILAGKQKLSLGEIGWWRIAAAVAVYAALLLGHQAAFGVRALP